MSSASASVSVNPAGFVGPLAVAFTVLKLVGVVHWSWLWVLSPLWVGFAVWAVFVMALMGMAVILGRK